MAHLPEDGHCESGSVTGKFSWTYCLQSPQSPPSPPPGPSFHPYFVSPPPLWPPFTLPLPPLPLQIWLITFRFLYVKWLNLAIIGSNMFFMAFLLISLPLSNEQIKETPVVQTADPFMKVSIRGLYGWVNIDTGKSLEKFIYHSCHNQHQVSFAAALGTSHFFYVPSWMGVKKIENKKLNDWIICY